MKVSKWVDFGQEVEVDVSATDVRCALSEAFGRVTEDRLGEEGPSRRDVLSALNTIATFLNGFADEHIDLMTLGQRSIAADFLAKASKRFQIPEGM